MSQIKGKFIADSAITAEKISNGAVTGEKLADLSVTAEKIATDAVSESNLQSGVVSTAKLQDNAVSGAKLLLENNEPLRIKNSDGSAEEIFKFDDGDILRLLKLPRVAVNPADDDDLVRKSYLDSEIANATISIAQTKYVASNGNDSTGDGSLSKPFATVSGALASITDASPTKRYAVHVAPGNYTEPSGLALKANVFVVGADARLARITGAVSLASDFSGSGDHRSGFSSITLLSAVDLNWATVTSAAGKIYCREVLFGTTVNLYGHNNAIAQGVFEQCQFFGAVTMSGINLGAWVDNVHFAAVTLNQHPNGGMASIMNAIGCNFSAVTANATTNDFSRRCSLFLKSCFVDSLTVNGPGAYADMTNDSVPRLQASSTNGGNLVYLSPVSPGGIQPDANNSRRVGDFGKQWLFNFAEKHASTGSDLSLMSAASSSGPESAAGRSIKIISDANGLAPNINGGDISLETASPSGSGVRGKIQLKARVIDAGASQIKNLEAATDALDAVNKAQLDTKLDSSLKGANSGVAELDGSGRVPVSQLPAIAITDTFTVASQAEMTALVAEVGDVAVNTTESKSYILAAAPATNPDNWKELLSPTFDPAGIQSQINDLAQEISNVDVYAQDIRGDLDDAISAINTTVFRKESIELDNLDYFDLDVGAIAANSLMVHIGRLALFEGTDYTTSVVGGKIRVTFTAELKAESAPALDDQINVSYWAPL